MLRVTARELIEEISEKSGLSVHIVEQVARAETQVLKDYLRKGYQVHIAGQGTYIPTQNVGVDLNGTKTNKVTVKCRVSDQLKKMEFTFDGESEHDIPDHVITNQIASLLS